MPAFLALGEEIAGYRLESFIGRGGMAVVYRAEDLRLGRHVALKLLAPELAENAQFRQRFTRESKLAASIDHPNIIPIYEAGDASSLLYIVMRYVDGMDLKALLDRERRLEPAHAVDLFAQVAGALDAAHARGLVHRDVKPGNILVASGHSGEHADHVYLTDFGLTKKSLSITDLTIAGHFVGTIDYAAPEQISSKPVDGRADIYALGCVIYQSLAGVLPFERDDDAATLWAHMLDPVPPLTSYRPDLPVAVNDVFYRAMAKSPDDRYPTCRAIVAALRTELAGWHTAETVTNPAASPRPATVTPQEDPPAGEPTVEPRPPADIDDGPAPDRPASESVGQESEQPVRRISSPRPQRRTVLIAALVLAFAIAAALVVTRAANGPHFVRYAGTNATLPVTLDRPSAWRPEGQSTLFLLISPHDLSDLFNGNGWSRVTPLLADAPDSVVGVYMKVTGRGAFDTRDVTALKEGVVQELQVYGSPTITVVDQHVAVDDRWAVRFDGVLADPNGGPGRLRFSYYVVPVTTDQQTALHVITFGAAGTFESNRSTFDHVIKSLDVDGLAAS